MKREKNFKTAKFTEALEYIDVRFIEEAGKKIKERPTGHMASGKVSRTKSLRQVLALVACVLLLSAVIPAVSYLVGHLPDILGSSTGDTTEQTAPETPPEETTVPAPETTVVEITLEETTAEPETTECTHPDMITREIVPKCTEIYYIESYCHLCGYTKREPQDPYGHRFVNGICKICGYNIESDGSQGLEYWIADDGKSASLVGIGTCTDKDIVVASSFNGLPVTLIWSDAFNGNTEIVSVTIPEGVTYIDKRAFANCTALKTVSIPSTVTALGETAVFINCTSLESIVLPEGINYLGTETFKGCSSLKNVVMDGVTSIDISAFEDCVKLNNVVISRKCAELSDNSFRNCRSLTDFTFRGTIAEWERVRKLTGWNEGCPFTVVKCIDGETDNHNTPEYDGSRGLAIRIIGDYAEVTGIGTCTDTEIVIPSYYSGYPVVQIDQWAFKDNTRITSVKISDTVTMIESNAFAGCTSLRNIHISASVSYVTAFSFDGCTNITSITIDPNNPYYEGTNCIIQKSNKWLLLGCRTTVIPDDGSVEYIGGMSFSGISGLYSITVPEGVIDIDTSAFNNCPDLRELHLPSTLRYASGGESNIISGCNNIEVITIPKNSEYFYVDGNCLIERKTGTLVLGCKTSVIPTDGSIKAIGYYAFHCNPNLKNIVLPEGITRICQAAFAGCKNLQSVTFPKSLKEIDGWAFENCTALQKINIPENVTLISYGAFRACTKLTEAVLPRSLKELSWDSFGQCTALEEIRFTGTKKEWNSITKDNSWYYGSSINAIRCSDGDVELNEYDGSRGLEYRIDGDHAVLVGIGTCTDTHIVVASTFGGFPVTEIGERAFADCFSLESITIPEGVRIIGNDAFNFCRSLTTITLPSTLESIGDRAFFECVRVEEFRGSENIISIGANAFDTCNSLISIKLGNKLQKIGSEAFKSCMSLKEITVPASVTSLGEGVFAGCSSLTKAVILPKIDVLGGSFFSSCALLREVTLPEGLKEISHSAFRSCASLSEIDIPESVSTIGEAAFAFCHSLQTVALPTRLTSLGMSAFQSSGIVEIVIPSGVGEIPASAFAECISLTKIVIPEGVTRIQNEAFYICTKLTSVSLPSSVTEIGSEAFAKSALTEIVIPDSVTWIWEAAFRECKNLISVKLGNKVELIMESAFADCTSLGSVRIPASVKEISNGAFTGCSSLESVTIERGIKRFGTGIFVQCHSLSEIVFTGTVAEWRKIEIPERAFGHTQNEIIRCSDGDFFTHSDIPAAYRDILFSNAKFILESKKISLDEFRFPSGGVLITLCNDVKYAVVDMDRDGLPEVVITGDIGDMLVLHEENGIVYGLDFTFRNMDRIKTDGSFEWNDTSAEGLCYGDRRISFDGEVYQLTDICHVIGDGTDNVQFFVDEKPATLEEYLSQADLIPKSEPTWYPLETPNAN